MNSALIDHALLDTWAYTGIQLALDLAIPIAQFIMEDIPRNPMPSGFCFSYSPIDNYCVHNANVLGASLLLRLGDITGQQRFTQTAYDSLAYTLSCQRADGSWVYSERKGSHWVDSFHTGFVLQGILTFVQVGKDEASRHALLKGARFYCENFFLPDGPPKYYPHSIFPIDIHCPAQALALLPLVGKEYHPLALTVARWMIGRLRDPEGFFFFRKHRFFSNRIPYMRWEQAWAFHGLTTLYLHCFDVGAGS